MSQQSVNARRVAYSIAPGVFLAGIGGGIVFPILPIVGLKAGLAPVLIGLILAGNRITRVIFNPWVGAFIDRLGGKRLLTVGLLCEALIMVVYWLALHTGWIGPLFLVCRLVWGPASALILIGGQTLALNAGPTGSRGAAAGVVRSAQSLGTPAGMVFGGIVAGWLGNGPAFLMGAGAALVAALAAFRLVPDLRGGGRPSARWLDILSSLRDRRLLIIVLVNFVSFAAVQGLLLSTLIYVIRSRHFQLAGYSIETMSGITLALLLVASAIAVLLAGRQADRARTRAIIAVQGLSVMIPGYLVLATTQSLGGLILGLVLVGVGMGTVNVPLLALIGDFVDRQHRGSAVGVLQLFGDVGGVLGPLIGTPVVLAFGGQLTYLTMTGALIIGLGLALILVRLERSGPNRSRA